MKCGRSAFYIDVNTGDIDTAGPHNRVRLYLVNSFFLRGASF
jgi:hypothetical protein